MSFVPHTPAGSALIHLKSRTEEDAWKKLLADTQHIPYSSIELLKKRGYTVSEWILKQH
jgi:hypothetical protein